MKATIVRVYSSITSVRETINPVWQNISLKKSTRTKYKNYIRWSVKNLSSILRIMCENSPFSVGILRFANQVLLLSSKVHFACPQEPCCYGEIYHAINCCKRPISFLTSYSLGASKTLSLATLESTNVCGKLHLS